MNKNATTDCSTTIGMMMINSERAYSPFGIANTWPSDRILITNYPGENPVIDGWSSVGDYQAIIWLWNTSNIAIQGLTIQNTGVPDDEHGGYGVKVDNSTYVKLYYNTIKNTARHGVVLEAHLQNVLVGVDAGGLPVQAIFRDLEGVKLVVPRNGGWLAGLAPGGARGLSYDAARGWNRVAYCLLVNHLAEIAAALTDRCPAEEDRAEAGLWADARQILAGIAGDGNYNRTLTPFGFQTDPRELWDGRGFYLEMSPFLYAERISGALLMYLGMEDQNVGTDPINSERMFDAMENLGKTAAMYKYPYEDHGGGADGRLRSLSDRESARRRLSTVNSVGRLSF